MTKCAHQTDEQLLLDFRRSGDELLFERLVERYRDELQGYLMQQLRDRHLAEDALQHVFLKVFRKCDQFQAGRRFRPWIYRIAKNQSIDSRRREGRHAHLALDHTVSSSDQQDQSLTEILEADTRKPEEIAERREQYERSSQAVDQLPPRLRRTVNLVYRDQMKYGEAAATLSVPLGTIKSRMNCALKQLRTALVAPQAVGAA